MEENIIVSKFEIRRQKFNRRLSHTKRTVSVIAVVLFLLLYTIAMGCKHTPDTATLENLDLNKIISNSALLHRTIFNASQLLSILYIITQVAVSLILIPLFIYLFFKTITIVSCKVKQLFIVSKSACARQFETTYIIQEKFLC